MRDLNRVLSLAYQVASYFVPASLIFAMLRWLLRTTGEMDAIEATVLALGASGFAGLTVFKRWGWTVVRLGPLKLDVFGTNLGCGIGPIGPWGWTRWYMIGDLVIVSREPETVVLRVTIPAYFARGANGPYWETAEAFSKEHCIQEVRDDGSAVFIPHTVSGKNQHLPTEIVVPSREVIRGHLELKVELNSYEDDPPVDQREAWFDDGPEGWKAIQVVIEDLVSKRRLVLAFDELRGIGNSDS